MGRADPRALPDDRLWSVGEVAYCLGVPVATLYYWRHRGDGPASCRLGRHVRYRGEDVRAWVASRAGDVASPG